MSALYCFGPYVFDPARGSIAREGSGHVELRPKAAEVAKYLLDNAGQVVTREALMGAVWPEVFVTDDSITQAIVQVRRALGDDGGLLRTLPRRGYMLDAAVTHAANGAASPGTTAAPPRADSDDRPSIAVLPFEMLPPDGQDRWFADGVIEGIVHVLSGLQDLIVISRASSLAAAGSDGDARRVAAALGVRYVLCGTVFRLGERLRMTAQLVEAESGRVLRSEQLDGQPSDLFDMQDRIAAQAVGVIAPTVRHEELRRAMRKPPESMTAYHRVLQALDLMPRLDQPSYEQAGWLLGEAVALDPGYAPASAYAALWHLIRIAQGWSPAPAADAEQAGRLAAAALDRDPQNAWALAIEGHLLSYTQRAFDEAAIVLDRAIAFGPNNPMAWAFRSATSSYLGDGARAIGEAEHALRLSPLDPFAYLSEHFMARAHYVSGDATEAVRWARRVAARNPRHAANLRLLIVSLVADGQLDKAREVAARYRAMHPDFRVAAFAARTPLIGEQAADYTACLREAGLPD